MKIVKQFFKGWNAFEYTFLTAAIIVPIIVGIIFQSGILEILASMTGLIVALLFAKAKIEGYFLGFVSLTLYAIVSCQARLYGEVIVSLAILLPVVIYGVINWLRNKLNDEHKGQVVKITHITQFEVFLLVLSQIIMGVGYYFMLKAFNTEFLLLSVLSVMTAFIAEYLVARRYTFALLGWLVNDIVILLIWIMVVAGGQTNSAVMIVMPCMYIINEIYGIFSWRTLKKSQEKVIQEVK